jgi:hypothetical protein
MKPLGAARLETTPIARSNRSDYMAANAQRSPVWGWVDPVANRCFQAPDQEALKGWTSLWEDLIEFEIVPVLTSIEFWSRA